MKLIVGVGSILIITFLVWSLVVSRPLFNENLTQVPEEAFVLAPVDQVLSFARTLDGKSLLVADMNRDGVLAVDLALVTGMQRAEPLSYFREIGYDETVLLLNGKLERYAWAELGVPFDATQIIGTGTNFQSHAAEIGLDDGPFLFPKLSYPTSWRSTVEHRPRLDYEVELCAIAIDDLSPGERGTFAYVLCNDFTDRWALVKAMNFGGPLGRTGFPEGKGGEGMLPVGAILAVPRRQNFYESIKLGLAVNGRLRQFERADLMIWDANTVAQKALFICEEDFYFRDGILKIADCSGLPRGTTVLLGTPAGVAFQVLNIWIPWVYLEIGDSITTFGTHLGLLETMVVGRAPASNG